MSESHVRVIRIGACEKHPNADSLSITKVHGGYPVIFRTGEFGPGDLAVYIPVDSVVPDAEEWSFLGSSKRIKAKKLRGVFSMGLLSKLPFPKFQTPWEEGQDMAYQMGITKYTPPEPASAGGENEQDPGFIPHYTDIEGLRKFPHILTAGESVIITEKIHGCNARFCFRDGRLWCGSHTTIKRENPDNLFWKMADKFDLRTLLAVHPGRVFYGEIFGWVQDLRYGAARPGDYWLRFFDVYDPACGQSLDFQDAYSLVPEIPWAPILYRGPWAPDLITLAEGQSTIDPKTIREGFVVRPECERWNDEVGRVVLKYPGEGYLTRKERDE